MSATEKPTVCPDLSFFRALEMLDDKPTRAELFRLVLTCFQPHITEIQTYELLNGRILQPRDKNGQKLEESVQLGLSSL